MDVVVPNYFHQFSCIGSACQDTCCSGWTVDIDRATFHKYRQNKHPELVPLFKTALTRHVVGTTTRANNFGKLLMKSNGDCQFLQSDRLCMIQRVMGPDALSHTCSSFPRNQNQFGAQRESSLTISCPQAALFCSIQSRSHSLQLQIHCTLGTPRSFPIVFQPSAREIPSNWQYSMNFVQ